MEVEVRVTDTQWLLLSWAHFIAKEASRKRGRAVACVCVCVEGESSETGRCYKRYLHTVIKIKWDI